MFYYIQKIINRLSIIVFFIAGLLLYGCFYLIRTYTTWKIYAVLIFFVIISILTFYILNLLVTRTETYMILKMIRKGNIALAKVTKVSPYGECRDITLFNHRIYEVDVTVYTLGKTECFTIYEDVKTIEEKVLPGYCYVTYDNSKKKITLVPTFLIFISPSLKLVIKNYEDMYHPHYLEIVKDPALRLRNFKNKVVEKQ